MILLGWNVIPRGYGARYDAPAAPLWLRGLFHTPFLDRFAYPLFVRRGHAYLTPQAAVPEAQREPVPAVGWRIEHSNYIRPGSVSYLQEEKRDCR
ncbi:MAG: hypothetical protein NVS3B26_25990 [Mycobacteriales bacterium]